MKLSIEFRDTPRSGWMRSRMAWTFEDVAWLNRACGYEKYRVAHVTA